MTIELYLPKLGNFTFEYVINVLKLCVFAIVPLKQVRLFHVSHVSIALFWTEIGENHSVNACHRKVVFQKTFLTFDVPSSV